MISSIVTSSDKLQKQNAIRRKGKMYLYAYVAIVAFAVLLPVMPFYAGWIKAANTEPEEAVAMVITETGTGTAFLISENYMLTARHVVEDVGVGGTVQVDFQQAQFPFETSAEVIAFTPASEDREKYLSSDVALLRLLSPVRNISPLVLGDSESYTKGDIVVMGYGHGDWSAPDGKITSNETHGIKSCYKVAAVGANIGHSGSPVLVKNANGEAAEIVGIYIADFNTVLTKQTGRVTDGEGVALKINNALQLLASQGYGELRDENLK